MESFSDVLQVVLGAVVTAVLPILTGYVVRLISAGVDKAQAATAKIEDESTRNLVNSLLDSAEKVINNAVLTTNQTFVDSIKQGGNKLSQEQASEAFEKTKSAVLSVLNDDTKKAITDTYSSIDEWLMLKIESAIAELKSAK